MQLKSLIRIEEKKGGLKDQELVETAKASLPEDLSRIGRVLLIPPDATRSHSGAGRLTNIYYHLFRQYCRVDILPALGTHVAMTESECADMFGDIPFSCFLTHNWRSEVEKIGTAPKEFVRDISDGLINEAIDFEINLRLMDPAYELIVSIGQVVPHEVVGMANYTKNILVGCGGSAIINASHMLGAFYGLERLMGRDHSPVRRLFDYAEEKFLKKLPISYVLTVTSSGDGGPAVHGVFIGRERMIFEQAVSLSTKCNITLVDQPFQRVVVFLDPKEFKSTWLGNKAIYRTRMAIADGGELIILAPGVERFGEDGDIDRLICKYGYRGREYIIGCCEKNDDIRQNLSAAAHLIHGSSDGRFKIVYCPGQLSEEDIRGVGFDYMPYSEAVNLYDPEQLKEGLHTAEDGSSSFFYISNPAVGLWAERSKFTTDEQSKNIWRY